MARSSQTFGYFGPIAAVYLGYQRLSRGRGMTAIGQITDIVIVWRGSDNVKLIISASAPIALNCERPPGSGAFRSRTSWKHEFGSI